MSFSNKLITEKNGSRYGRMIQPWLRKKTDMIAASPSRRDGMTYDEELSKRQQGGVFIYDMVSALTQGKGEHGLSGVAASLFNRFFNLHSFKSCDFRDIAAACVFLAGKNEDTPKKLKYVVNQLWQLKYPTQRHFPSEQTFIDQCGVVTFLEEILLKTVSFDINVDLPHQHVLKLMRDVEKGRNVYKEMVKTAYYMATDVLIITDWSVRYSCASVATACVNIAAFFHNINMDEIVPVEFADKWFCFQDASMTRAEIDVMTREFLDIFARNPQFHIGSLRKIDPHGKVKIERRSSPQRPPQQQPTLQPSTSSSNLKKIDLESYKGRQRSSASATMDSATPTTTTTVSPAVRPSFLPDVKNRNVVERGLAEHAAQQKHYQQRNHHQQQQQQHYHQATSSSSSGAPAAKQERFMAKRGNEFEDGNVFRSKKSRMENGVHITYDESTTTTFSTNSNGVRQQEYSSSSHVESSMYARHAPPPPPRQQGHPPSLMSMVMQPPPPPPPSQLRMQQQQQMHQHQQKPQQEPQSEYQKMCMQLDQSRNQQYTDNLSASSSSSSSSSTTTRLQVPPHLQRLPHQKTAPGTTMAFHQAMMNQQQMMMNQQQQQIMSSTQQISPPEESSPPPSSSMLLPPPPPPPVLMPILEEGELA